MSEGMTILRAAGGASTRTLLNIIQEVLAEVRYPRPVTIYADLGAGEDPEFVTMAINYFNRIHWRLYTKAGRSLGESTVYWQMDNGVGRYSLPGDFLRFLTDVAVPEHDLELWTPARIQEVDPGRALEGEPEVYAFSQRQVLLYPIPSELYLKDKYVYFGAAWWCCVRPHTADDSTHGDPSVNSEGDWIPATVVPMHPTLGNTDEWAWASGNAYLPGRLQADYRATISLLRYANDVPLLPPQFYTALIQGTGWLMRQNYKKETGPGVAMAKEEYLESELLLVQTRDLFAGAVARPVDLLDPLVDDDY